MTSHQLAAHRIAFDSIRSHDVIALCLMTWHCISTHTQAPLRSRVPPSRGEEPRAPCPFSCAAVWRLLWWPWSGGMRCGCSGCGSWRCAAAGAAGTAALPGVLPALPRVCPDTASPSLALASSPSSLHSSCCLTPAGQRALEWGIQFGIFGDRGNTTTLGAYAISAETSHTTTFEGWLYRFDRNSVPSPRAVQIKSFPGHLDLDLDLCNLNKLHG